MIQKLGDLSAVVKMQKESEDTYDRALACIQSYVNRPETEKQKRVREKIAKVQLKNEQLKKHELEKQLKQQGDTKFSFQVSGINKVS
jgi:antitoxin component HigA of HigAB toxin-antitoxin module